MGTIDLPGEFFPSASIAARIGVSTVEVHRQVSFISARSVTATEKEVQRLHRSRRLLANGSGQACAGWNESAYARAFAGFIEQAIARGSTLNHGSALNDQRAAADEQHDEERVDEDFCRRHAIRNMRL